MRTRFSCSSTRNFCVAVYIYIIRILYIQAREKELKVGEGGVYATIRRERRTADQADLSHLYGPEQRKRGSELARRLRRRRRPSSNRRRASVRRFLCVSRVVQVIIIKVFQYYLQTRTSHFTHTQFKCFSLIRLFLTFNVPLLTSRISHSVI